MQDWRAALAQTRVERKTYLIDKRRTLHRCPEVGFELPKTCALIEQWQAIKNAASNALIAAGGTITHHHAVGRDHRPWYDRERPDLFAAAFAAAKSALDPGALFNPGVLVGS